MKDVIEVFQFAYNTARHETIGYTSAYFNHGRELDGSHPDDRRRRSPAAVSDTNRRRLEEAYKVVRTNLARGFQWQENYYNLWRRIWKPTLGEKIRKRLHYPAKRRSLMQNSHRNTSVRWKCVKSCFPLVELRDEKGRCTRARFETNVRRSWQQQRTNRKRRRWKHRMIEKITEKSHRLRRGTFRINIKDRSQLRSTQKVI